MYTGRGVKMKAVQDSLAVAGIAAETPANVIETKAPEVVKQITKSNNNRGPKPEIGGYY